MYVIGLTGNFGTGKSTVARILAKRGVKLLDADKLGHELLRCNSQVKAVLINIFGISILDKNNIIDRRKLGRMVFKSEQKTAQLNRIMKPRIREFIMQKLAQYRKQGIPVTILEAALLKKDDWKNVINEVWVTTAPQNVILQRLKTQRGYDEHEVLLRLSRQLSPSAMLSQADVVINTDCSLEELRKRVNKIWSELLQRISTAC